MRWSRLLPLALVLGSLVAGCTSSASGKPGALRLPLYPGELVADPAHATSSSQIFMASLLYSGLVRYGPDLHVIPDLAVSIPTISGDGSSYTFTVRRDARFADGTRCRASDIAYSLARALSPAVHSVTARRYLGEIRGATDVEKGAATTLSGVQILNPLTLKIRLAHPDANFLQKLAFPAGFAVERKALSRGLISLSRPAGTGPWVLRARQRNGSLYFVPRRHYYGGPLQLNSLTMVPVRDTARSLDIYKRGEIDASYVPPDAYGSWSHRSDFHVTSGLTGYYAIPDHLSASSAPSLDREKLLSTFAGALTPLDSIVPPAVPDYVPSGGTTTGSGLSGPAAVGVSPRPDSVLRRLRAALAAQLQPSAGTAPDPITIVAQTYLLPVPGVWLSMVLPRTASPWFRYELRSASTLTNDPVSRMSVYSTLEQWALNHHLVVPLASANVGYVVKPSVSNLEVTAVGLMPANGSWNTVQVG